MSLREDRFFDPDPEQKRMAMSLFASIEKLPIISPHGHVDPTLFSEADYHFEDPVSLLIKPDHYLIRMLISQGLTYDEILFGKDPRQTWRLFCDHFYLFRATPSGIWLRHSLETVFKVTERLTLETSDRVYDQIQSVLRSPDFTPRRLFSEFNIEVLATTDGATDKLTHHQKIHDSGWKGRVIPTFRPDELTNLLAPGWRQKIDLLSEICGFEVSSFSDFIRAIEARRDFFRSMGATATDSGVFSMKAFRLSAGEVEGIFRHALDGTVSPNEAEAFTAHMLMESARMSVEDGMVMQVHPGVYRNHNPEVFDRYGADRGFDIPVRAEFTNNLQPLLKAYGNSPKFKLLLFTLDETTYTRELAPLAGAYPSVKLGPPWWFNDSLNGMRRYFDQVVETAGIYNLSGFNDDTRAFLSIPARHDVWRRAAANWLANQVLRGLIEEDEGYQMARELAYDLAKKAYNLS